MIIADTGFFLALANPGDRYHPPAVRALQALKSPLITTYPVITEACYLLLSTHGNTAQRNFLSSLVSGVAAIFQLETTHLTRMVMLN
jgi:uncharacterized protein